MSSAEAHLKSLVEALEATHWSSWQNTAKFDLALTQARRFLDQLNPSPAKVSVLALQLSVSLGNSANTVKALGLAVATVKHVYDALEDSEEFEGPDGWTFGISKADMEQLTADLDEIDELPDVMTPDGRVNDRRQLRRAVMDHAIGVDMGKIDMRSPEDVDFE